ncbi:solute carrier family 13 member 5 isoform X1 [Rhipicephalus sanguineus]|uniref:solute carrier family 13 member 5 isoform X1 n=2 Tax=Rhipicephalus sanguineus TaxID=34632 RepID=UPI001895125B|nr:solute carrier family 13 member 5 isoform X1 [Rhipicephalus sanguineus]
MHYTMCAQCTAYNDECGTPCCVRGDPPPSATTTVECLFVPTSSRRTSMEDKIPVPRWKKALKPVLATATPLVLLPIPLSIGTDAAWVAFVTLWMGIYYVVEPVPLSVTSLLPIVLLPFLGILSTEEVASFYLNNTGLLFMASLMIATAIESSDLHERLAFKCLLTVGTSEGRVLLGLMSITVFMSMWMPNTAVATIMGPMAIALAAKMVMPSYHQVPTNECFKQNGDAGGDHFEVGIGADPSGALIKKNHDLLKKILLLSIAYSSNIGGTGSIIGSSTNILFKGIIDELFPHSTELTSATWMLYNVPPMIVCTAIGWIYLWCVIRISRRKAHCLEAKNDIRREIQQQYQRLGSVSFAEYTVLIILAAVILVLFFYKPHFMTGWGDLIKYGNKIKSSSPALAICFLLFVLPKDPRNLHCSEPLVSFKDFSTKMPWGIVILFGGCLSIAEASQRSGLSAIVINTLNGLRDLPPGLVLVLLCFSGCFLTEVVSTYVVTGILTPIISELAVATRVHPLYFLMPVKACCLFAFMLPIATGANAILCDMGRLRTVDMMKMGFVMNVACVLVQLAAIHTIGPLVFDLYRFPSWATRDFGIVSMVGNDTFASSLNATLADEMVSTTVASMMTT